MKTEFSARTLHDDLPTHAARTTASLVVAWHVPSAKPQGHVPLRRAQLPLVHTGSPYEAKNTSVILPGHEMLAVLCSATMAHRM